MSVEPETPEPGRPIPPVGGWTADAPDTLPRPPPHTELIDGNLVFASPRTLFDTRAVTFFEWQWQSAAPDDLEVVREFTIDIDRMKVSVPFPADLDLTRITPRRSRTG